MFKNLLRKFFRALKRIVIMSIKIIFILALSGAGILLLARLITAIHSAGKVYTLEEVPQERAAIIFGAGLTRDGYPTAVLRDRVKTGVQLYEQGKVEKLLMSGDNRFVDYDEPTAMKNYALDLGVPEEAIVLDFAGRRTYDTCYRAKEIFGLDSAILVTQEFHLSRALYICNRFGVKSTGVSADQRYYLKRSRVFWNIRETLATLTALWDVHIARPLPVLGELEPIFDE